MNKLKNTLLLIAGCFFLCTAMLGCSALRRITEPITGLAGIGRAAPPVSYSGPKASLVVADFEVRAAKASPEVGLNLREMLLGALFDSKRFKILEFKSPNTAKEIEKVSVAADVKGSTAAEQGEEAKTADLIITVALTDFEPQISGGREGLGGGGGVGSGILGGLLGEALKKAYLVLEIRIVDSATSSVLATNRIQGQASDITGEKRTDEFSRINLVGGLSSYNNTPIEKAIRMSIVETARYLTEAVPPKYYKY